MIEECTDGQPLEVCQFNWYIAYTHACTRFFSIGVYIRNFVQTGNRCTRSLVFMHRSYGLLIKSLFIRRGGKKSNERLTGIIAHFYAGRHHEIVWRGCAIASVKVLYRCCIKCKIWQWRVDYLQPSNWYHWSALIRNDWRLQTLVCVKIVNRRARPFSLLYL